MEAGFGPFKKRQVKFRQWSWHSRQIGHFRNQRTYVQIQSSALVSNNYSLITAEKMEIKKRPRIAKLKSVEARQM